MNFILFLLFIFLIVFVGYLYGFYRGMVWERRKELRFFRELNRLKSEEVQKRRWVNDLSEKDLDKVDGYIEAMDDILSHFKKEDEN